VEASACVLPSPPTAARINQRGRQSIRLYKPRAPLASIRLAFALCAPPHPHRTQQAAAAAAILPGEARRERASGMAGGEGMVFEPHAGAVAGGDVVFCAAIVCLSLLSMVIFAATAGSSSSSGAAEDDQGMKPWRRGRRANGPVFVGGRGCGCGGCSAGAGVCGTYLS